MEASMKIQFQYEKLSCPKIFKYNHDLLVITNRNRLYFSSK